MLNKLSLDAELNELKVLSEVKEVKGRLEQFDLDIDGLRQAVQQGLLAKLNVTSNYPRTAQVGTNTPKQLTHYAIYIWV